MNARFCLLLGTLLLTNVGSLLAQPGAVRDSITAQLNRTDHLTSSKPDQALAAAQSALALARKHGIAYQQGKAHRQLARIHAERDGGGVEVARLASGDAEAGSHTVQWNGADQAGALVSSGMYLIRCLIGNRVSTVKVVKGL